MQNQILGVDIDQTVVIKSPPIQVDSVRRDTRIFKGATLAIPAVKGVTVSSDVPGSEVYTNYGKLRMAGQSGNSNVQCRVLSVDYDFFLNYAIEFIAGRDYSPQYPGDEKILVINRSATALFGFSKPEDIMGKQMVFAGSLHTVVGVTEDFHQQLLRDKYDAIIFDYNSWVQGYVSVKINAGHISKTIASLKSMWAKYYPCDPFDYYFLDNHFNEQYQADQRFGKYSPYLH